MTIEHKNTLSKEERLHGRNQVEDLFKKAGSHSMAIFPLRVVYAYTEYSEADKRYGQVASVSMLVSVPKKHFKRAVKRNRVKRQVREAYRIHKHSLRELMNTLDDRRLTIAFIWLADELYPSSEVEAKVEKLLTKIEEKTRKHICQ